MKRITTARSSWPRKWLVKNFVNCWNLLKPQYSAPSKLRRDEQGGDVTMDNQQESSTAVMKTCTVCKEAKDISNFHAYTRRTGKAKGKLIVAAGCKPCEAERARTQYHKNKAPKLEWSANRYKALKDEVFSAYGGYVCSCCGETEPMFLAIDHVNNDGAAHRREIAGSEGITYRGATGKRTYYWLVKHKFPAGFQVLCANCNHGKHRNGGICPHQLRTESSTTIPLGSTSQAIGEGSAKPLI